MVSDTIQFIYNNKIFKIKNPNPNKTILDFVRSDLKKTGTKEGCAEGGCGACTIVLGELKNQKLIYKSINSCISFLPILNGKHLILIENLSFDNKLHPIQEAMVKFHGSQCGFCTPGFVMSIFAMYKNFSKFNDETIDETLSGNLCRCTGYRPIIDAAKSLNHKDNNDHFKKNEKKVINLLKKINDKEIEIQAQYVHSYGSNYIDKNYLYFIEEEEGFLVSIPRPPEPTELFPILEKLNKTETISLCLHDERYFGDPQNLINSVWKWSSDLAKEREKALDYDSAIEIWDSLDDIEEAARVRKLKIKQGAMKVDQTVIKGDQITKTKIKDSVLNRSNVGSGGDDKFARLEKLTEMKEKGLIDDDDYEKMKREIIG